jgi:hypothetical protein
MSETPKHLTAFYDLAVAPVNFDFVNFLLMAEIERRDRGYDAFSIVFVPGQDGEFMPGFAYGTEQKRARLNNILVPACALFPQCSGHAIADDREAARRLLGRSGEGVYPVGYTVDVPIDCFLSSEIVVPVACDIEIPSIVPPPQAIERARIWIAEHAKGRKAIAITLREASHGVARNSDLAIWGQVARSIEAQGYCPIVIRDTERALDPTPTELSSLVQCPDAAVDLCFRAALYEEVYLNLVSASGPFELCRHNVRTRFLLFHVVEPGWHDSRPDEIVAGHGVELGMQPPFYTPFQRIVWEEDTFEKILAAFRDMVSTIETKSGMSLEGARRKRNEPALAIANRLNTHRRWRQARAIYCHLLEIDPHNTEVRQLARSSEASYNIGLVEHDRRNYPYAERWFREAIGDEPQNATYHSRLGMTLLAQGQFDAAIAACDEAIFLNPDEGEPYAVKALILEASGRVQEGEAFCRGAINNFPMIPIFYEILAELLKRQGRMSEAIEYLRNAAHVRSSGALRPDPA